jgi:hypothetical protein
VAAVDLGLLFIELIIKIIILAPALWLAGRVLAGDNAKFIDAVWIIILGTMVGAIFSYFNFFGGGLIALIIQFIIWLALVKHFFNTGWIYAFIISVLAVIMLIVIAFILGLIGLGLGLLLL